MDASPEDVEKSGPPLWGLLGRDVGSVDGYEYTMVLAEKSGVWDYDLLNSFLRSPRVTIPGTRMDIDGVMDDQDRADIIAYLRTKSDQPYPLP